MRSQLSDSPPPAHEAGGNAIEASGRVWRSFGATGNRRILRSMRCALWILAICAFVAALRLGRDLLVPVLLAVLLALVLSGIVEALRRARIPRALSALVLLLVIGATVGGMLEALRMPAQHWVDSAPRILRTIEHRIQPAQSLVRRIDAIARRASALASPDRTAPAPTTSASSVMTVGVVTGTGWLAGEIVMATALTLLLLAAGPDTLARMAATLAADWHALRVLRIIDAVRVEVGRYYRTLALINVGFGIVTGVTMWSLGMPNPMLWGVLAGVLNFVPYLGCATTFTILTMVSLVAFDQISHTLMVSASFLVVAAVEGHIIEPIFLGRRLDLNPIVILIALWFGGWMWGVAGVLFTLPTLVAAKAAASRSTNGETLVRFLSPHTTPTSDQSRGLVLT
jgi:predicted PurR-regulated permease PerM